MKNKKTKLIKWHSLIIIALVAVIGFSIAACNSDIDNEPDPIVVKPDDGGVNPNDGGTNPDDIVPGPIAGGIESSEYPGLFYIEENGAITITRYSLDGDAEGRITIPSVIDGKPVTCIGQSAFRDCANLTSITIPDSVTSIGEWAFHNCTSLTSVIIPESVTNIGDCAFHNCTSLTEITIEGDAISDYSISGLFYGCTGITNLNIGKNVTNISERRISHVISEGSISHVIFESCAGLTTVNVDPANTLYSSVDGVVFNKDKTVLIRWPRGKTGAFTMPENVTDINTGAFYYCTGPISINIGSGVTNYSFIRDLISSAYYTVLTAINIDPDNTLYSSVDGVVFNKDKTELCICPRGKTGAFTMPNSVTNIWDAAFYGCTSLTGITIGNSVPSIGRSAFRDCSGLTEITIPNSVTSIDHEAFSGCTSLASITIGNGVTYFLNDVFDGCTSLTTVNIGSGVTSISNSNFKDSTRLTDINVDAANPYLKSINGVVYRIKDDILDVNYIYLYPQGRTGAFVIPDGVTEIWGAFQNCTGLTQVTIPHSVTRIGNAAFYGCSSLTSVTIPPSVTNIGDVAFYGCSSLNSVTIPHSVTKIGGECFSDCVNLTKVTLVGTISEANFGYSAHYPFYGDLRSKFYATDAANGTPGTYTTTAPVNENSTWNKVNVNITISNVQGLYDLNGNDNVFFTHNTVGLNWTDHLSGSSSWTWLNEYASVSFTINPIVEGLSSQSYSFSFFSEDVLNGPEDTYWYRRY